MVDELRVERLLRAVSDDLARRLGRAVGFRNVLVHEYVSVDDDVVLARLEDPSDLEAFVTAVATWLSRQA